MFKADTPVALRSRGKGEALLVSLALAERYWVPRETLLCTLWPDSDLVRALQSLSSLVYALHRLLGDALGGDAPVVFVDGGCELNTGAGVGVDIACFDALVVDGERRMRLGDVAGAVESYRKAVQFYRGDVTAANDVRAIIERERLRARYLTLLARLADRHFQDGDYQRALEHALHLLLNDPCREDAHRMVIRCHLRLGERAQALRQYEVCTRILAQEFETSPEPATQALYATLRADPDCV